MVVAAVSYATLVTTYMANFTLVQLVLKANDLGLETDDLKYVANNTMGRFIAETDSQVNIRYSGPQ